MLRRKNKRKVAQQKLLKMKNCSGRVFIFTDHNSKEFCKKAIEILRLDDCEYYTIFNVSEDPSLLNVLGSKEVQWSKFPQFFLNEVHLGGINELVSLHENGYLVELIRETSVIDEDERKELFAAYFQKKRLLTINPDVVIFQVSFEKRRTTNVVVLSNCSQSFVIFRIQRRMYNSSVSVDDDNRFLVKPHIGIIEPKKKNSSVTQTTGMVMVVVSLKSKSKQSDIQTQMFPSEDFIVESQDIPYEKYKELMRISNIAHRNREMENLLESGKVNFQSVFKVIFQEVSIRD